MSVYTHGADTTAQYETMAAALTNGINTLGKYFGFKVLMTPFDAFKYFKTTSGVHPNYLGVYEPNMDIGSQIEFKSSDTARTLKEQALANFFGFKVPKAVLDDFYTDLGF